MRLYSLSPDKIYCRVAGIEFRLCEISDDEFDKLQATKVDWIYIRKTVGMGTVNVHHVALSTGAMRLLS